MSQIQIPQSITVKDFAKLIEKNVSEVIKILMENGFLATINESLDFDTATIIAEDLGFEVEEDKSQTEENLIEDPFTLAKTLNEEKENTPEKELKIRPAVVTILGHVDHGKTTLLDTIKKTKVAEGESGGITQHINAYQVKVKNKTITFVDTPGHEAFQKMRSRGAGMADIAVIIVAADDGVKPQTKEVIKSVQAGNLPFLICLNKIDKPEANPEKVKGELAELGVLVEEWGGKIPMVEISAKLGKNIDELLETIILVSEMEDLKANFKREAIGLVIESHLDKKRGPIATVIIKSGTLKKGDCVKAGGFSGKAKLIENFLGEKIVSAPPGTPVTILGFNHLPDAGSVFQVVKNDRSFIKLRKTDSTKKVKVTQASPLKRLEDSLKEDKYKKLNVVLKADTQGSLEALLQIIENLKIEDVVVKVIKSGVGQINESDIVLAKISHSILYGFRVSLSLTAKEVREKEKIEPRFFDVIYHLLSDTESEMKKIITMKEVRVDHGTLKVLAIFRTDKKEMIFGGKVTEGKIMQSDFAEIERNDEIISKGKIKELKEGKTNVRESGAGQECGILFSPDGSLVKIKEGDILKSFIIEEQTLGTPNEK